jgi:hypothetical protein
MLKAETIATGHPQYNAEMQAPESKPYISGDHILSIFSVKE